MSYGFAATTAFKPQIRQEGFHLPSNNPPSPSNSTNGYDPASMFMLPDAFRKYNESSHQGDFSDDLASILVGAHAQQQQQQQHQQQQHHQQQQQHPSHHEHRSSSYDDGYRPQTHNIFDISAPSSHHLAASATPSSSLPIASNFSSSAFSLQSRPAHDNLGLISPPSSLNHPGPLHEFTPHTHFNSTLPALGSSMRFEGHAPAHDPAAAAAAAGRPGSTSSVASAYSLPQSEFPTARQQHTPSPVMAGPSGPAPPSRSRSRSRAPSSGPGPTRTTSTTRAKRNSISSTSPPPRPVPASIVIPGALHRQGSYSGAGGAVGTPLVQQLHSASATTPGGWYLPTPTHSAHPEFSLPTPDSISSHFGLVGARDGSLGPGVQDVAGLRARDGSPTGVAAAADAAAKQVALANEKRRRRRESHNAVERRRRDNINEKIGELATLIPECMLDPNAPANYTPSDEQIFGATLSISAGEPQEPIAKTEDIDPSPTPTGAPGSSPDVVKTPTGPDGPNADTIAAKANKGMILRKSVDYIRYLQQLVGAQASRNRDLETQLAGYRARDPAAAGTPGGDDMGLVLHEDVDVSGFMDFAQPGDFAFGAGGGFAGFGSALTSVRETPMDVEGHDDDGARPGTAMTDLALTSPSVGGSGSPGSDGDEDDEDDDILLEERGRRGRDGRIGGAGEIRVKTEGSE